MNHPPPQKGCADAAFFAVSLFSLTLILVIAITFRKEIDQAFDDYRGLPARVKSVEESLKRTNEMLYKNLKP